MGTALLAQPVITAADAPAPGHAWTVFELASLPPLTSGANATWNLSGATITGTRQLQLAQPSTAPGASNFPSATVVANADAGPPYNFLQATSNELRTLGVMTTSANVYTDPLVTMVFPCSLGTTWSDTYANANDQGTRSYTADGYGTLIGPGGTLSNVLRVHSEYTTLDTVVFGVTYLGTMVEDAFWRPGTRWPVATSFWLRVFADGVVVQEQRVGSMLDVVSSVHEHDRSELRVVAWPNPAVDQIHIASDLSGVHELSWLDLTGRMLVTEKRMLLAEQPSLVQLSEGASAGLVLRITDAMGRYTALPILMNR
jgi:hypothetical protein